MPAKSPGVSEERKGPRVGAPEQAIAGFVKSAGLKSIKDAQVVTDERKGDFYVVRIEKPGRKAGEIIAEVVPDVVERFPWTKSMRWGAPTELPLITEKGEHITRGWGQFSRELLDQVDTALTLSHLPARWENSAISSRQR